MIKRSKLEEMVGSSLMQMKILNRVFREGISENLGLGYKSWRGNSCHRLCCEWRKYQRQSHFQCDIYIRCKITSQKDHILTPHLILKIKFFPLYHTVYMWLSFSSNLPKTERSHIYLTYMHRISQFCKML